MKAVRVHDLGGPEALRYEEIPAPSPQSDEVLVKIEAAGVNFLDIYYRSGFHWGGHYRRALPYIPGAEASGTVVGVGPDVKDIKIGDRLSMVYPMAMAPMPNCMPCQAGTCSSSQAL